MEKVTVSDVNEVYVRIDCSDSVAYELRDHFTFMVPGAQFTPQYRAKLWDGRIRLMDIRTKQIYRGLVTNVEQFCASRGYTFAYKDELYANEFSLAEAIQFAKDIKPKHEPRDYQLDAFTHAIRNRRNLLLSPTASGKSLIIYLLVRYILSNGGSKGLIIVPTISLVEQLNSDFKEYSETNGWNVEDNCHKIYQGQEKITDKAVTISTWQSIYKMPKSYFEQFDFVIGDEAHQFKAKSLTDIMTGLINDFALN